MKNIKERKGDMMEVKCGYTDVFFTYAGKVCKKLHLSEIVIGIISPFLKKKNPMSPKEAMEVLEYIEPKPEGEATVERSNEWNHEIKYDLQIIVPAYNAEEYIEECVDSLLSQKTTFIWQALIVNDGSTDRTGMILGKYESDPHIKVLSQENRGFSGARNRGLDMVSSRYVMFVDSDDRLEPGAIQNLMSYATKHKLDIVEGNFNDWINGKTKQVSYYENQIINNPIDELRGYPWGKVVSTDLFRTIEYPENYWYEDSIFSFLIYPQCNQCGTIKNVVYSYRRNPNGISMSSKGKAKCLDTYYIAELMIKTAILQKIELEQIYDLFLGHILFSFQRISALNIKIREAVFVKFCDLCENFFSDSATEKNMLKKVEEALKDRDYGLFELYCRVL